MRAIISVSIYGGLDETKEIVITKNEESPVEHFVKEMKKFAEQHGTVPVFVVD